MPDFDRGIDDVAIGSRILGGARSTRDRVATPGGGATELLCMNVEHGSQRSTNEAIKRRAALRALQCSAAELM